MDSSFAPGRQAAEQPRAVALTSSIKSVSFPSTGVLNERRIESYGIRRSIPALILSGSPSLSLLASNIFMNIAEGYWLVIGNLTK